MVECGAYILTLGRLVLTTLPACYRVRLQDPAGWICSVSACVCIPAASHALLCCLVMSVHVRRPSQHVHARSSRPFTCNLVFESIQVCIKSVETEKLQMSLFLEMFADLDSGLLVWSSRLRARELCLQFDVQCAARCLTVFQLRQ